MATNQVSESHTVSTAEKQGGTHIHTQVQGQCHEGTVSGRAKEVGGRQEGAPARTGVLRFSLRGGLTVSQIEEGGVTTEEAEQEVHSLCPVTPSAARPTHA